MPTDALQLLEYPELLSLVAQYAGSPLGRKNVLELAPSQDLALLTKRLELAEEAREHLRAQQSPEDRPREGAAPTPPLGFSNIDDPGEVLAKLHVEGTVLEIPEIVTLLKLADGAEAIRRSLLGARRRFPRLAEQADSIADFGKLTRELSGKILPNGELDDRASPELNRIRREIEKQRTSIFGSLRALLRGISDEDSKDEIITIRGDRFVVPVRAQKKGQVRGVVHGSSSSGQTVYVEPLDTIEMNNELVRLREEELQEIHRILRTMTARLREQAAELSTAAEAIGVLDLAFASGRFAVDYGAVTPSFSSDSSAASRLHLKAARHPLLAALLRRRGRQVVPLTLTLESDQRVLVISGPNTGGKTVALKTAGLLTLMAASGLPVPAEEAELPLVDHVLADIGDYQSIQESLSTFSSHLLNIASMMEHATARSLVLLDELGGATDPEEAGALAVAIVDRFRQAGAFTIASTHHMAVKAYATNTPGILSASMGFDEETLAPTYQIEIGRPGKSSGIAIAQRLGLPADVIARAKQSLSAAHLEAEEFLARLRADTDAAARSREESERKLAAIEQREREWAETVQKREADRAANWERHLDELARSLEERAEQKLRDLAAQAPRPMKPQEVQKKAAQVTTKFREQARDELRQTWVSHLGASGAEPPVPAAMAAPVFKALPRQASVGDTVKLKSLGKSGIVRGKSGNWLEVEIGVLRTRVPFDDIEEVTAAVTEVAAKPAGVRVHMEGVASGSLSEINVIGETAEDARSRVDKFLDNAFLAQLSRVRVIHGSGKGILRRALAELFSGHPHVEKFFPATQDEGGAGATIVELKQ